MKITRRQLRKLILQEFKETGLYNNFNFVSGGGSLPPIEPPRSGGGGGGDDGPFGFGGGSSQPCDFGNAKSDKYYDMVFTSFPEWLETNMITGNSNPYDNYLNYLNKLPGFSMDLVSNNYMEFFELIMTIMADYACKRNITDLEKIYKNPLPAITNF
tara:strand:+ start:151 stop:621 length:471 start_codon:yes stop_codon:yes gene_type:complete